MDSGVESPKVVHPREDISFMDELPHRHQALYPARLHGYEIDYIISLIHNDTVACTDDWAMWRSTANAAVDELENYLSSLEVPKNKRAAAKHRRKHTR